MRRILAALMLAGLTGCATPNAPAPATPTVDVKFECLPLPAYSAADQAEFAKEVAALNPYADREVLRFLGDYKAMRDGDRACLAKAK